MASLTEGIGFEKDNAILLKKANISLLSGHLLFTV
jgi:hypothetical protein